MKAGRLTAAPLLYYVCRNLLKIVAMERKNERRHICTKHLR